MEKNEFVISITHLGHQIELPQTIDLFACLDPLIASKL